jgi:hypothetical protein
MAQSDHSPVLNNAISEVHGLFATDAALQDAVGKLTLAGFDRAELSLPAASPRPADATPAAGAAAVGTETDTRQMRTLLSSTAGVAAAMGAAGLTIATGGAAAAVFAAAAGGAALAGGATAAATSAAGNAQQDARDQAADAGELVLAVRAPTNAEAARAESVLHEAGAMRVERVVREGASIV